MRVLSHLNPRFLADRSFISSLAVRLFHKSSNLVACPLIVAMRLTRRRLCRARYYSLLSRTSSSTSVGGSINGAVVLCPCPGVPTTRLPPSPPPWSTTIRATSCGAGAPEKGANLKETAPDCASRIALNYSVLPSCPNQLFSRGRSSNFDLGCILDLHMFFWLHQCPMYVKRTIAHIWQHIFFVHALMYTRFALHRSWG